jgi:hypothetical protein
MGNLQSPRPTKADRRRISQGDNDAIVQLEGVNRMGDIPQPVS